MNSVLDSALNCPPHLLYVSDEEPGISREKKGGKFYYFDSYWQPLEKASAIKRIEELVIPPMWQDVWICSLSNGHLQATGKDEKNRKQYLYHSDWTAYRQSIKYAKLKEFGHALPEIRKKINEYLQEEQFTYRKTIALAIKLLDCNYLRIGNDFYLNENETYGLTTIRRKHLHEAEGKLELEYKAKSGKFRKVKILDKKLGSQLRKINELPGYEIFRYRDGGRTRPIHSEDVNNFIKEISGQDFTAKDFRTWGGTVSAVSEYSAAKKYAAENKRRSLETAIVRGVSKKLGNTVSTARQYYIHPKVLKLLVDVGPDFFDTPSLKKQYQNTFLDRNEAIALAMIQKED